MSSALVRLSGWRFIQPVDWLVIAFYAFGLVDILRGAISRLSGQGGLGEENPLIRYATELQTR